MNQDQVKELLLKIDGEVDEFTVTFSGKNSKKVDGLYKPESREILIHNRNFESEDQLIYTAIHEFAHHLQFTRSPVPVTSRAHTTRFWNTFHTLLRRAEELGLYANVFKTDSRFVHLTAEIKGKFLRVNGELMKEFGAYILQARELCVATGASFDDYVDRELGLGRNQARAVMKVREKDVDPSIGFENMKMVAAINDDDAREMAVESFNQGYSPDMVKAMMPGRGEPDSKIQYLMQEKDRVEKSIDRLTVKLAQLELKIDEMKNRI